MVIRNNKRSEKFRNFFPIRNGFCAYRASRTPDRPETICDSACASYSSAILLICFPNFIGLPTPPRDKNPPNGSSRCRRGRILFNLFSVPFPARAPTTSARAGPPVARCAFPLRARKRSPTANDDLPFVSFAPV